MKTLGLTITAEHVGAFEMLKTNVMEFMANIDENMAIVNECFGEEYDLSEVNSMINWVKNIIYNDDEMKVIISNDTLAPNIGDSTWDVLAYVETIARDFINHSKCYYDVYVDGKIIFKAVKEEN